VTRWLGVAALLLACGFARVAQPDEPSRYFAIRVIDEQTGRGVPLVELTTVNNLRYVTDNAGLVAFDEPGLMDRKVYFHVRSHGYSYPKDGFGNRGVTLAATPGTRAEIKLKRENIAERLYRVTGQGLYRDSTLLGEPVPLREPNLNALVMGQDSVQPAVYQDKIFWFWGDTERARYPLGHFRTAGATSELPSRGGLSPDVGVDLKYFTDNEGFSRGVCPLDGPGPVWLDGVCVVEDEGQERLIAHYSRMESLAKRLEHGIVVWNDEAEKFEKRVEFDLDRTWQAPAGHALRQEIAGVEYLVFANPLPTVRVNADLKSVCNQDAYAKSKPGTIQLKDVETGKSVNPHGGAVRWNAHLKKWIAVFVEAGGSSSYLGEVWFAAANDPTGPWQKARKIVTHDKYSFYNPALHDFFDRDGGRYVYFEGTYTHTFSGNLDRTPRYDYNQVMYRLDLDDERLREVR
jgi:hypothetical protein